MAEDYSNLLVKGDAGEVIGTTQIKVRTAQMNGDFSVMQATVEPHQLLVPHTHENEDQVVFVISGSLEFEVGGEGGTRFTASAGDYVIKPRKVSHGFWNITDETALYIELSGSTGFENFVDSTKEGAMKAALQAESRYGVHFHSERIPSLMKAHQLTSITGLDMPWEGQAMPFSKH